MSKQISELESELAIVRGFYEADEKAFSESADPLADKIFYSSTKKRKQDLEKQLFLLKSERAHELLSLRLIGNQMAGSIKLRSLTKIVEPLNALLEQCAWKFWDKEGRADRIEETFSNLLDLRLAGIESGSTKLLILGNTSPDLTGDSALEEGLKNIFNVLASSNDEFSDSVHAIGIHACRSLSRLMDVMEKQNLAAEFSWGGPDRDYTWEGRPAEIVRIKSILDEIDEPHTETQTITGLIQMLSIRNRIEIYCPELEKKISLGYHRSLSKDVESLHLGDKKIFVIEKTTYSFKASSNKRDVYTLKSIKGEN